jgi:glyoxylase-like metal-dependent hydrolase (beta-lactamase superfamily II)
MRPLPRARLRVLEDGEAVMIGRRVLRAVDTPGHAWHHHVYFDPDARVLFGGDVTGIRLAGQPYVRPPTPPPDLDVERWIESLDRIRELGPVRLLPTHFGGSTDVEWHLEELRTRLVEWKRWAAGRIAAGDDLPRLAAALERKAHAEVLAACGGDEAALAYEEAVPSPMLAAGFHRYLTTAGA